MLLHPIGPKGHLIRGFGQSARLVQRILRRPAFEDGRRIKNGKRGFHARLCAL